MSDRTSAGLFASLFEECAKHGEAGRTIAHAMWPKRRDYDFNDYQMYCDDALMALGLAKRGPSPDDPSSETQLFLQSDGTWDA